MIDRDKRRQAVRMQRMDCLQNERDDRCQDGCDDDDKRAPDKASDATTRCNRDVRGPGPS